MVTVTKALQHIIVQSHSAIDLQVSKAIYEDSCVVFNLTRNESAFRCKSALKIPITYVY